MVRAVEAKLPKAHITQRNSVFFHNCKLHFFHLTHICRGVTFLCTPLNFLKPSLRVIPQRLETFNQSSVYCDKQKTTGGQIQPVCFVITVYMLSPADPFPDLPQ